MITLLKNVYLYCILQYFLLWPVRLVVWVIPLLLGLLISLSIENVGAEEPSKEVAVIVTDRLPHNYWKDERAAAQVIREQIKDADADFKFAELDFTHTNLEDRGTDVKVNYEEELRPYMYKKHLVDVRDHAYFMEDGKKPRKPLKDYLTLKNLAITAVGFVGLCILLGYIDEKLDNMILDDLKAEQKRIDEHLAREWAIRVQEWSARWHSVKRWWGGSSSGPAQ